MCLLVESVFVREWVIRCKREMYQYHTPPCLVSLSQTIWVYDLRPRVSDFVSTHSRGVARLKWCVCIMVIFLDDWDELQRAKFPIYLTHVVLNLFRKHKKKEQKIIYFHFQSFLDTEMVQIVKQLPLSCGGQSHAHRTESTLWASYQIRNTTGCACAGNAGNVFSTTAGYRSRHASRHVHDARAN